jgi:excisionase family DNA binding protein
METASCNLLSPRELSRRSGWPERRIRNLIAQNQLKHIRVGSSILVPFDAIDEFVKTNMVTPSSSIKLGESNGKPAEATSVARAA